MDVSFSRDEALRLLVVLRNYADEHGRALPHEGGDWPLYSDDGDEPRVPDYFGNKAYLKLLRAAELPIDPAWRLAAERSAPHRTSPNS